MYYRLDIELSLQIARVDMILWTSVRSHICSWDFESEVGMLVCAYIFRLLMIYTYTAYLPIWVENTHLVSSIPKFQSDERSVRSHSIARTHNYTHTHAHIYRAN